MKKTYGILVFTLVSCASHPGPIKRQMIGLLEKFDRWDYNGDGYLVASELKDAEQASGLPAAEIVEFYDTNKDNKISLREAKAGLSRVDEARKTVKKLQS